MGLTPDYAPATETPETATIHLRIKLDRQIRQLNLPQLKSLEKVVQLILKEPHELQP